MSYDISNERNEMNYSVRDTGIYIYIHMYMVYIYIYIYIIWYVVKNNPNPRGFR